MHRAARLPELFVTAIVLLILASCGTTMKGYPGPDLPDDRTAILESGPYAYFMSCDGERLGSLQLKVRVLPGTHKVEMMMRRRVLGSKIVYSNLAGSITFNAQAGHRYLVDVELVAQKRWADLFVDSYDWAGRIVDEGTHEIIAVTTEPLPARIEWVGSTVSPQPDQ